MGLGKFPHPSLYMGIPVVSYCCHGDGSGELIPDGDLPIANTIPHPVQCAAMPVSVLGCSVGPLR